MRMRMKKLAAIVPLLITMACRNQPAAVAQVTQSPASPLPAASVSPATASHTSGSMGGDMGSMDMSGSTAGVAPVAPQPLAAGMTLASTILDPNRFQDPLARDAYEKAHEVAERLDKMYCYCHCHEHMGHRSLLTCYQGDHAAECGICQKEAEMAWADWKNGLPVEATQRAADAAYNQGAPPPSLPD